jgi:hypothetical protein
MYYIVRILYATHQNFIKISVIGINIQLHNWNKSIV